VTRVASFKLGETYVDVVVDASQRLWLAADPHACAGAVEPVRLDTRTALTLVLPATRPGAAADCGPDGPAGPVVGVDLREPATVTVRTDDITTVAIPASRFGPCRPIRGMVEGDAALWLPSSAEGAGWLPLKDGAEVSVVVSFAVTVFAPGTVVVVRSGPHTGLLAGALRVNLTSS
jgi:hypothetical protein